MQKITPPISFDMVGRPQLVVATLDERGEIDTSNYQLLSEWNRGIRNRQILEKIHGYELVNILATELGMIDVDKEGILRSKIIITPDPHISAMRLLGKIAEVLIVNKCNNDIKSNRLWGMYARRGKRPHKSLDRFRAVGTSMNSTKNLFPTKYNPLDTQRDIIWISKDNPKEELLQIARNVNSAIPAGLQIKVSHNGFNYIYKKDIVRGKYEVPLVYFDLSNDYYKITNAIYQEFRNILIGVDIIRGKDIDPEIHDMLISYYFLVVDLIRGKLTIDDLLNDKILFDSFAKEIHEQAGRRIITV